MKIVEAAKYISNIKRTSHLKKGLFLHIQKTAGSSLITLAKKHYGNDLISHGDYVGYNNNKIKNKRFISGHFGYDFARHFIDDRYSFTFLRNPVDRILSFYYFHRTRSINEFPITRIAHEMELEEFLTLGLTDPEVKSRIWNNQTWQLSYGFNSPYSINDFSENSLLDLSMENLNNFSYVGFVETFEQDLENIMPSLGIQYSNEVIPSKINSTKNRLQINDLPDSTLAIMDELTSLDKELYKHAQSTRVRTETCI